MAPQPQPQHRTWCKKCNKFTLHVWHNKTDLVCKTCDIIFTSYKPSEVPKELLTEQRNRYKASRRLNLQKMLTQNIVYDILLDINESYKPQIIECDAGQKQIDLANSEEIQKYRNFKKSVENDYQENYSKLNRNDKCSCGSGKKYKQCHLIEFKKHKFMLI